MAGVPYTAPIRCVRCGMAIQKKPRAKTPKYCPTCRMQQQADWKRLNNRRKNNG